LSAGIRQGVESFEMALSWPMWRRRGLCYYSGTAEQKMRRKRPRSGQAVRGVDRWQLRPSNCRCMQVVMSEWASEALCRRFFAEVYLLSAASAPPYAWTRV